MIRLFPARKIALTIRLPLVSRARYDHCNQLRLEAVEGRRELFLEAHNLRNEIGGLRSDVRAAEMAYEESRASHQRVAQELARLRAAREKGNANLAAANAKRKADAAKRKGVGS